ncbi:MAG: hypothetical protein SFU85_03380 [Candidatus Methylacidiphilales bacterium]|nr:hypothetical protein [Candidatus Methylacidiphilales bacterium]
MAWIRDGSGSSPGFSLIEVTLALGITAFALVLLVGLLPVGLQSNKESREESIAVNLVNALIADLRLSPQTAKTVLYQMPAVNDSASVTAGAQTAASATLLLGENLETLTPPTNPLGRYKVEVTRQAWAVGAGDPVFYHIRISSPFKVAATAPLRSVETVVAIPRN